MQPNINEVKARLGIAVRSSVPIAKITRPSPVKVCTEKKDDKEYLDVLIKRTMVLLDGCTISRRLKLIILPVLQEYDTPWKDLVSPSKANVLKNPRRQIWALLRDEGMSLPQIGRLFNRDHTTVLHGLREFEKNG